MNELLAHLVGDYILQTHWMATEKVKRLWPAIVHGVCYTLPFLLITRSAMPIAVVLLTHIVIDRYRLAVYLTRLKNWCLEGNGYPEGTPVWLSTWLVIILDNTMHLLINHFALTL